MICLDEMGKQCPLPVIEAKKALETCPAGELVEVLVDNEIAVQNLEKLAGQKGLSMETKVRGERAFAVRIRAAGGEEAGKGASSQGAARVSCDAAAGTAGRQVDAGTVVVLSSGQMGQGDEELGKLLMKGFVYALTQRERAPELVLLYNGGAHLSCEGSDSLEDLRFLESQGAEILTCGTCLNHYGLSGRLGVGAVTNMYEIAERMAGARLLVRP